MVASSRALAGQLNFKVGTVRRLGGYPSCNIGFELEVKKRRRSVRVEGVGASRISCCCSDSVIPIRRSSGSDKSSDKGEEWRFDLKKSSHTHRVRIHASPALPFASTQYTHLLSLLHIRIRVRISSIYGNCS